VEVFEAVAIRGICGFLPDPVPRVTMKAALTITAPALSGSRIRSCKPLGAKTA
jgi:hypothetical protein